MEIIIGNNDIKFKDVPNGCMFVKDSDAYIKLEYFINKKDDTYNSCAIRLSDGSYVSGDTIGNETYVTPCTEYKFKKLCKCTLQKFSELQTGAVFQYSDENNRVYMKIDPICDMYCDNNNAIIINDDCYYRLVYVEDDERTTAYNEVSLLCVRMGFYK